MLNKILTFLGIKSHQSESIKRVAFIDGDGSIPLALSVYDQFLKNKGIETHFIRLVNNHLPVPRVLNTAKYRNLNKILLNGFSTRKEITDKFIGAYIQKCICDGYNEITVVSSDYDFIDIFKMAAQIDQRAKNLTFRLIVPKPNGQLAIVPDQISNIEIIRIEETT